MSAGKILSIVIVIGCVAAAAGAGAPPPLPPGQHPAPPGAPAAPPDGPRLTGEPAGSVDRQVTTLSVYTPPTCVPGVPFSDITCTTGFDAWIEQFARDGITAGCGGGLYCPGSPVTRDQMAVFIEKSMRGTANWPPHTVLVFHHPAAEAGSDVNSGTELLNLVAAIPTTGAEAPSSGNPWLIKVGPGIFDLGSGSLALPQYTALEGAGREITVITATGSANYYHATVVLGNRGRLGRLTVNNTGGSTYEVAIYLSSNASEVGIADVAANASNPSNASGSAYAVFTESNTSISLVDCELTAHGAYGNWGLVANSSTDETRLDGVRINVYGANSAANSYGFLGSGASPAITNSRIYVSDGNAQYGVYTGSGGGALDLRNSEIYTYGAGAAVYTNNLYVSLLGDLIYSVGGYGISTNGSGLTADINACNIRGANNWLYNGSGYTVTVGASKLVGTTVGAGTTNCYGNYTASGFLPSTCP